jgi:hypothetical protein
MKNLFRTAKRAVGLIALVYISGSCIDGELPWDRKKNNSQNSTAPVVVEQSYVSIYQASPAVSNADIVVDDVVITKQPLNYGQQAKYLRIGSGARTLKLQVGGNEVSELPITLDKEQLYSVYLVDNNTQPPAFLVMPVTTAPMQEGNVRIRFINLSPDAPDANLVEDSGDKVLFDGMSFKETADFIEIPAQSSYDLTVRSKADNSILVQIPAMRLYKGWTYTVMLRGYHSDSAEPQLRLAAEVLSEVER